MRLRRSAAGRNGRLSRPSSVAAALAAGLALCGSPAAAGAAPQDPQPSAASLGPPPLVHGWAATFDYGQMESTLDVAGTEDGDNNDRWATLGLEALVGRTGFARIEIGREWNDSDRVFGDPALGTDQRYDGDATMAGVTAGAFVTPFLAVGMTAQHRRIETRDLFVDRASGMEIGLTEGRGHIWTLAPFAMLAASAGPFQLTLTGTFVHSRGELSYDKGAPVPPPDDKPAVDAQVIDAAASYPVNPRLRLGASLGWTKVTAQRVTATGVALDEDWGTLGIQGGYDMGAGWELRLHASRDVANARGDRSRFGVGVTYRF